MVFLKKKMLLNLRTFNSKTDSNSFMISHIPFNS